MLKSLSYGYNYTLRDLQVRIDDRRILREKSLSLGLGSFLLIASGGMFFLFSIWKLIKGAFHSQGDGATNTHQQPQTTSSTIHF